MYASCVRPRTGRSVSLSIATSTDRPIDRPIATSRARSIAPASSDRIFARSIERIDDTHRCVRSIDREVASIDRDVERVRVRARSTANRGRDVTHTTPRSAFASSSSQSLTIVSVVRTSVRANNDAEKVRDRMRDASTARAVGCRDRADGWVVEHKMTGALRGVRLKPRMMRRCGRGCVRAREWWMRRCMDVCARGGLG